MAVVPNYVQQGLGHLGGGIGPGKGQRQVAGAAQFLYGHGILFNVFFVEGVMVCRVVQAFIGQSLKVSVRLQRRLGRTFPKHTGRRKRHGDTVQNIAAVE